MVTTMFGKLDAEELAEFDRENARTAAFLQQVRARQEAQEQEAQMVFKTHDPTSSRQAQDSAIMNDAAWNSWAANIANDVAHRNIEAFAKTFTENFIDATAEAMSERDAKLHGEIRAEIDVLRKEVAELKAQLDGKVTKMTRGHNVDDAA